MKNQLSVRICGFYLLSAALVFLTGCASANEAKIDLAKFQETEEVSMNYFHQRSEAIKSKNYVEALRISLAGREYFRKMNNQVKEALFLRFAGDTLSVYLKRPADARQYYEAAIKLVAPLVESDIQAYSVYIPTIHAQARADIARSDTQAARESLRLIDEVCNKKPVGCAASWMAETRRDLQAMLGDSNAIAAKTDEREQREQKYASDIETFQRLARLFNSNNQSGNLQGSIRAGDQLIQSLIESSGKKSLNIYPFLTGLIALQISSMYERIGLQADAIKANTRAQQYMQEELSLEADDLDRQSALAQKIELNRFAKILSNEARAVRTVGDATWNEEYLLVSTDANGLRKADERRTKLSVMSEKLDELGAKLSAQWHRERFKRFDVEYRKLYRDVADAQERLKREAIDDERRRREGWQALTSALGYAAGVAAEIDARKSRTAALKAANRDAAAREQEYRARLQRGESGQSDTRSAGQMSAGMIPGQSNAASTAGQMHSGSARDIGSNPRGSRQTATMESCKCGPDYIPCFVRNAKRSGERYQVSADGRHIVFFARDGTWSGKKGWNGGNSCSAVVS